MRFELLDHPADIGFRVYGGTPAELFANAAWAMLSIAAEPAEVRPLGQYELSAEGTDYESLLVNWLNEVLYWYDGARIAFSEIQILSIAPTAIRAQASGEPRDPARHRSKVVVKAATYHQVRVAATPGGWVAEVYLDV